MTLSPIHPDGMALLRHFEGLRTKAYPCPAGVWTIGYGHTGGVKPRQTITQEEAEELLREDVERFVKGVRKAIEGTPLNAYRFSALVCFAFNVGMGAFEKSTLLKKIKEKDFDGARLQFFIWNKVNGKASAGLTRRRNAEAALFSGEIKRLNLILGGKS